MQTCHMLMAEPSTDMLTAQPVTYDMFLFQSILISKYENIKFESCHMLTAEPSTYDMFLFQSILISKY